MSATTQFSESNGAGETVTDGISNINFGSVDTPNLTPSAAKIVIPGASVVQSFEKYLRFHVSAMGGSSSIGNLKLYKSGGAYVTGEVINSNSGSTTQQKQTTYHTPDQTLRTVTSFGNIPTTLPTVSNCSITSLGVEGTVGAGTGTLGAAGYSQYFCLSLQISSATPAGAANQKVFTLQYDES